jgi:hypothetical protein
VIIIELIEIMQLQLFWIVWQRLFFVCFIIFKVPQGINTHFSLEEVYPISKATIVDKSHLPWTSQVRLIPFCNFQIK